MMLKIKTLIRLLTPPIVWNALRQMRHRHSNKTFEGVYNRLCEIHGTSYNSSETLEGIFSATEEAYEQYKSLLRAPLVRPGTVPSLLPLLISLIKIQKETVSVLDFGGGMGISYIDCLQSIGPDGLEFHIVDLEDVQEKGKQIFEKKYNVRFYSDIALIGRIDVVHIGGSLQYIDNYRSLMKRLIELEPGFIFFTNTPMGKAPTYATAQVNMKGLRIPCWIFQLDEIVELMGKSGYRLVYKTYNDIALDFGDIPDSHRAEFSLNLLFSRDATGPKATG